MKIYKDIFTGDEMFSDKNNIELVNEVLYEVTGNKIQVETDEGHVATGIDIVDNHRLCETLVFTDKSSLGAYFKEYMKRIIEKIEEKSPDQVENLKANLRDVVTDIINRFSDLQFYTGESMDTDAMIAIMEYRDIEGTQKPIFMFIKHGLEEEEI